MEKQQIEKSDRLLWYQDVDYTTAKNIISDNIRSMSKSFIAIGYYLKHIRDKELYREDGYGSIWEFAESQYGIKMSTASRWMAMNDKFSKGGNSPLIAEEYKGFGKSQLQEMLYLTDEQMEQATPEMPAKEIRKIRKPEPTIEVDEPTEEPLSVLGHPKRVYPEDSLIATKGCGKYDCFSCHRECNIRQKDCYCVEAPMGHPFPCDILKEGLEDIREGLGDYWNTCQFLNLNLAHTRAGDGEPVPCCKECKSPCRYQCRRAAEETLMQGQEKLDKLREDAVLQAEDSQQEPVAPAQQEQPPTDCPPGISSCIRQEWGTSPEEQAAGRKECKQCWKMWKDRHPENPEPEQEVAAVAVAEPEWPEILADIPHFSVPLIRDYLWDIEKELKEYLDCVGLPEPMVDKKQMEVAGLRLLLALTEKIGGTGR